MWKQIDFNSLVPDPTEYLNEELKAFYADVVYSAKVNKQEVKLVFLLEHKSYVERQPYLQLLEYMMGIWRKDVQAGKKKLTPVVPMVIYHGKEIWSYQSFSDYFQHGDIEELIAFIPSFDYFLTNLSREADDEIMEKYDGFLFRRGFYLMKHVWDKDLSDKALRLLDEIDQQLSYQEHLTFQVRSLLVYLTNSTKDKKTEIMEKTKGIAETWGMIEGSIG
ncbi:MAG: Rpn family recombination-promoting nuclease/putative transposase, partial [Bacteroidota bacterium]